MTTSPNYGTATVARPLAANVPTPPPDWTPAVCPYCGAACWRTALEPPELPLGLTAACSACAFRRATAQRDMDLARAIREGGGPGEPRPGVLASRVLPDGRRLDVLPLLYDGARLGLDPPGGTGEGSEYADVWDYEVRVVAVMALTVWDGTGEPPGWTRHPRTGRRRPGGDPAAEYVRS